MFKVASFGLLFLALIASCVYGESYTTFDGSTYVTYSYSGEPPTFPDNILLVFKTIKPSGLLFHATSSGGDFITLELLRGKIRYLSLLGSVVVSYLSLHLRLFSLWSGMLIIFLLILKARAKFVNCLWKLFIGGSWLSFVTGANVLFIERTCFEKEADSVQQKRLFSLFIAKRLRFMQVIIIGNIWSNLCKLTLRNCKKKMKLFW